MPCLSGNKPLHVLGDPRVNQQQPCVVPEERCNRLKPMEEEASRKRRHLGPSPLGGPPRSSGHQGVRKAPRSRSAGVSVRAASQLLLCFPFLRAWPLPLKLINSSRSPQGRVGRLSLYLRAREAFAFLLPSRHEARGEEEEDFLVAISAAFPEVSGVPQAGLQELGKSPRPRAGAQDEPVSPGAGRPRRGELTVSSAPRPRGHSGSATRAGAQLRPTREAEPRSAA